MCLLEWINSTDQNMEMVERRDWGREMSLRMVQLFYISRYFFDLPGGNSKF